jgi:hypothetical protein
MHQRNFLDFESAKSPSGRGVENVKITQKRKEEARNEPRLTI